MWIVDLKEMQQYYDTGHTKGRLYRGGIGREGNQKLE
jgi:hypothetical protein